jgi:hypothetical protein
VPRLFSALTATASGVVLFMAAFAPACAQAPASAPGAADPYGWRPLDPAGVFRPLAGDPRNPGRFRRPAASQLSAGPSRFGEIPVYGNPPASGAGSTGFDSTNALRRKSRAAVRRKPGVSLPAPPQPGVVVAPALTSVPTRPSAETPRRGAAAVEVPAVTLVPAIATPSRRKTVIEQDPFAPVGLRAGVFTLFPAVELTGGYDSNPTHIPGGKASSLIIVAPELKVRSDWERHFLNADIKTSYTAYSQSFATIPPGPPASLDRPSVDARVDGRLDITGHNRLDGEARLLVGTDNPGSPNIQAGLNRLPIVTTLGGTLGYTQSFNRLEVTAKGLVDRSSYQQSSLTDGTTSSNEDRNFNQYGTALRGSYELTPAVKPFVEVGADSRVHDLAFDRNGEQRDSNGINAKVGSTFEFTRKLTGEASVGYLTRHYKDPGLADLSGATMDATLIYSATPLTTFTATAKSTVNEVILPGVSGNLSRDFGLQADHAFRRWLLGTAKLGFGIDDYVGLPRIDHRWYASMALTYKLTRNMQLKAEIRRDWLNSSVPGVDYVADQFLLGIRLQR